MKRVLVAVVAVLTWQTGLSALLWPNHPILATSLVVFAFGLTSELVWPKLFGTTRRDATSEGKPRIGIGLDEPIEVSPGKFVTAREMTKNARTPEEFDEHIRNEAGKNPQLARTLEQHFGWKNGNLGTAAPIITQILDGTSGEKGENK